MKSEDRNPKTEGSPKSEIRTRNRSRRPPAHRQQLLSAFGFRIWPGLGWLWGGLGRRLWERGLREAEHGWPRRRSSTPHEISPQPRRSCPSSKALCLPAVARFFIASVGSRAQLSRHGHFGPQPPMRSAAESAAQRPLTSRLRRAAGPPPILYTLVGRSRAQRIHCFYVGRRYIEDGSSTSKTTAVVNIWALGG